MDPEELFERYEQSGEPDEVLEDIKRQKGRSSQRWELLQDLAMFLVLIGAIWLAIWLLARG